MSYIKSYCRIVPGRVTLNGEVFFESDSRRDADLKADMDADLNADYITDESVNFNTNVSNVDEKLRSVHEFFSAVYGCLGVDYRRFYKMDALSKLGFLASELLLADIDKESPKEDIGIVLFNRSSSLETDCRYQKTIQDKNDYFPSPAEFVYTLPNIVTGEIAIRNKITGETSFYVISDFQGDRLCDAIDDMISFAGMKRVLAGWTEVNAFTGDISCFMALCEAQSEANNKLISLTGNLLENLFSKVYVSGKVKSESVV